MEVYVSRKEIRRRVMARMGFTTSDNQAPLTQDQTNEWIRAAALEVYSKCAWASAQRETFLEIGIDQRLVNYPASTTAGNIIQVGVWDEAERRYQPLRRSRIQVSQDDEPLVEIGEPDSVAGRGRPAVFHPKTQIELWPRADQAYQLKIDHTISPNLEADGDVSVVDAEAIILWVLGDALEFQGEGAAADKKRKQFDRRIGELRAWAHTEETFRRGRLGRLVANGARVTEDQVIMPGGDLPNSGTWPATMPGA